MVKDTRSPPKQENNQVRKHERHTKKTITLRFVDPVREFLSAGELGKTLPILFMNYI